MAYLKTLGDNWTLRDVGPAYRKGLIPPFPIERPMYVMAALKEQGIVGARPVGLEGLKDEWALIRCWLYETAFDWDGQDERCQLVCERVGGIRAVRLNGQTVGQWEADGPSPRALNLDISQALKEGSNRLQLVFGPEGVPTEREMGFGAPVRLRAGNFMTLTRAAFIAGESAIEAKIQLKVYTTGKYQFRYGVQLEDETAASVCLEEKLCPGDRTVCHSIPLEKTAVYQCRRPEETTYALRLSIERKGIGCQLLVADCAWVTDSPSRGCLIVAEEERFAQGQMALARALGAQAVCWAGGAVSPLTGLTPLSGEQLNAWPCCQVPALAQLEDMQALAGDQSFWPPQEGGIWAYTRSAYPDEGRMQALFGPNAMGDAGRAARLSRFWQAECVRRGALQARLEGKPYGVIQLQENRPCLGSSALVEYNGAARPAYDALQEAWKRVAVYASLGEDLRVLPGETAKIPLWLLSAGEKREVVRIRAACLNLEGKAVAGVTLTAMLGEDACAGEITCPLSAGEDAYILRVEAVRGEAEILARADFTLCACAGEAPLAPLMKLEGALLRERGGLLVNEGGRAALGVCSAGYRALLPGEGMPCADTYECLNGLV